MAAKEVAPRYNALPTLGEADEGFANREPIFHTLAALLSQYNNIFGLCLVHTHCKLDEGEIMLAEGNVSRPVRVADSGLYYPERWLSNGEPYEFAVRVTDAPPKPLADAFDQIVKAAGLQRVLGLYHIDGGKDTVPMIEWTEGRKNLTRELTHDDRLAEPVQTAWDFGRGDPVTMACAMYCDVRMTRSGKKDVHKETRTHIDVK
ncbi:hypothetical protein F5Y10DRAFT_284666 [Nemania abortiva]|nr:hypothetical protein F5Y10DRAFT_284666 [Nemania abortiva]